MRVKLTLIMVLAFVSCFAQEQNKNFKNNNEMTKKTVQAWEFENPISVSSNASFELEYAPSVAMYLFTAEGEKAWVPEWNPAILKGNGYQIGSVFAAPMGTFLVVDFNPETLHIFYTYVSKLEASSIEIDFKENGKGGASINVKWNATSLCEEGSEHVMARFSQKGLEQKLAQWKELILSSKIQVESFLETISNH